ncbi:MULTISPECIES: methyltransferase [unclassified Marinobacter]|uniref:class I SAM-dependent methyltransferase n=1 Tax=unclassified Marinobacter TaxID=83889 RepID=UPI00200C76D0|nr:MULTISPECIES: methyltransferase [unclassified Marinobacter]MCL1476737.1 methyltransferase [Marinobacter sp.]MCL1484959.1 methyltransferase [Marinobacter sp.]MCL1488100.1 methyltransferase [Marinobacter sp.]UQG57264.1 methyltransferase [Marinobacter sp. M4C]UQG66068.1 methyltransferase [Marinobacter sp. M2C]
MIWPLNLERAAPAPTLDRAAKPNANAASLQAWDAADELLLQQATHWMDDKWLADKQQADKPHPRVLVVDDNFGALTLGLWGLQPVILADSAALGPVLAHNLALNPPLHSISSHQAAPLSWRDDPVLTQETAITSRCSVNVMSGPFDLVVMRIPRYGDYLAWLLRRVNALLADDGVLLAGGMIKHLPDRSVDVFAQAIVTEKVCPARKKARVVICRKGSAELANWNPAWQGYSLAAGAEIAKALSVAALPAVFARDKLDIGTRALLPHVTQAAATLAPGARVLDLACGNGVLGLAALAANSHLELTFSDVSSQAVISAAANAAREFPHSAFSFHHADSISADGGEFDLILLNPPFHDGGMVGDHIALALFAAARRHLRPGGRLLLVGNRHLGYHRSLGRFFPQVRQLDANPKFVVLEASR